MTRFDRLTVFNTILQDGMVPLFYHGDPETWFVACVGMGSRLVRKDWIRAGDFKAMAECTQG